MKKTVLIFILILAFSLCSCDGLIPEISVPNISIPEASTEESLEESAEESLTPDFAGKLGSATNIKDGTVIVSIFADDKTTSWADADEFKGEMLRNLGIGAAWLTSSASDYDAEAKFYYAESLNSELVYTVKFDDEMVRYDGSMYGTQRQYILESIDSEALLTKYGAKNIIYAFFFNTELENEVNPWTLAYTGEGTCDVEIIDVFCRFDNIVCPPASLAHEVLHCFGAHDLYYASDAIPQAFVDHCIQSESKDIMYTVNMGDEITSVLTELAAYYIGLVDECALVDEWSLARSEYIK